MRARLARGRGQMTALCERIAGMAMEQPDRCSRPHRPDEAGCKQNSRAAGNTTLVPCPMRLPGGRETPPSAHQFML
jgi:hypothetical protein